MSASRRTVAWLLFGVLVCVPPALPVWAHATLVKSSPASDAVLSASPSTIQAVFSEELAVKGSVMRLYDASGNVLAVGGVDLKDKNHESMTIVSPLLIPGAYQVRWHAISADDKRRDTTSLGSPDERILGRQATEAKPYRGPGAGVHREVCDAAVGQLEKSLREPNLVEDLERRWMDRVPSEITEEVRVLLEHEHVDAGARQKKCQHRAGGPAPGDATARLVDSHREGSRSNCPQKPGDRDKAAIRRDVYAGA